MPEIKLEEFERKIKVRKMRLEDFADLVAMQALCFPGMQPWERAQIESQLRLFPDGQLVVEYDGDIVASSSSLIVDHDDYAEWHDFGKISDGGYIRNHTDKGDTLYGIEMMVHPEYRGLRLSRRLYDARKGLVHDRNLRRIIIGGRIPGYRHYADKMSAREYVEAVMRKSAYDPVLTAQVANGFALKRLIPGYMPGDEQSRGYATFLEWSNVDYVPQRPRRFQPVSLVRICVVQYQLRAIDEFDEFATQCAFFVDVASDNRADFVVFPELFTTQLLSIFEKARRPGGAERKLAELAPQYLTLFSGLAVKHNVNIVGGSMFTVEDDHLYNAAYLFRRDGTLERQVKLHVTQAETKWWGLAPGDRLDVFQTDAGRVAILLGNDIEYPELARIAASRGPSFSSSPSPPTSAPATSGCGPAPRPGPSRTTSTSPSPAVSATSPSSRTWTSTTPSPGSTPRRTSPSLATASPPSARPTSRP